jgi:hypothetical protein
MDECMESMDKEINSIKTSMEAIWLQNATKKLVLKNLQKENAESQMRLLETIRKENVENQLKLLSVFSKGMRQLSEGHE